MQAIVAHAAKDLRLEQRDISSPGEGELVVAIEQGGICGSDLHYYKNGGFGEIRLREPMILGHEVAGRVVAKGTSECDNKSDFKIGQRVAVSPSRPCFNCSYCYKGQPNHCLNMRFYGSAMPFPHIQGAFSEQLVVSSSQWVDAEGLTAGEAAMAEPVSYTHLTLPTICSV